MGKVAVVGLGLMGSALARAFHEGGHQVTVWNRTAAKAEPLRAMGIAVADRFRDAVAGSPVLVICLEGYAAARSLLEQDGMAGALAGRVVVQLSTGTPQEAHDTLAWMKAQGAAYLDGAILCGPGNIGTDGGEVVLAGEAAAWDRAGAVLACLAGKVRYLGPVVGAAATLDLAWLTILYGRFLVAAHAANMCRAEGVDLNAFIDLFPDDPDLRGDLRVIRDDSFASHTASLAIWGEALRRVQMQGRDAGISTDVPDFIALYFKRAVAAGYGQENVMALYKVVRGMDGSAHPAG